MMSAVVGGSVNVIGSSIAIVASGPMPGSTPISVPTSAPTKQKKTLVGVKVTLNPRLRLAIRSIVATPASEAGEARERRSPRTP